MDSKCKIRPLCMAEDDFVEECKFFEDDGSGGCTHRANSLGDNICSSWRVVRFVVMDTDFEVELD